MRRLLELGILFAQWVFVSARDVGNMFCNSATRRFIQFAVSSIVLLCDCFPCANRVSLVAEEVINTVTKDDEVIENANPAAAATQAKVPTVLPDDFVLPGDDDFVQMLHYEVKKELKRIGHFVDVAPEIRKLIWDDAQLVIRPAYKAIIERLLRIQNGQGLAVGVASEPEVDVTGIVRRHMLESIKRRLSPAEAELFFKETSQQTAFEREAAVRVAISAIDRQLRLSAAQRAELLEILVENWRDEFASWTNLERQTTNSLPQIDDDLILSTLTDLQKEAWFSASKTDFGQMFSGSGAWTDADQEWWTGIKPQQNSDVLSPR